VSGGRLRRRGARPDFTADRDRLPEGIGALAEARMLLPAAQARRARARLDWPACRAATLRVLQLARGEGSELGSVVDCVPIKNALGGFFACIAITGAGRRFVKGVLAGSREAAFWDAWRQGAVRTEGRHYRLVPPCAMLVGRAIGILVFPELQGLESPGRIGPYRRHVRRVVRAVADFNSDHLLPAGGQVRPSQVCDRVPVPSWRRVEELLGVGPERAGQIVAALRRVEPRWDALRDRSYRSARCLCHMDLGRTNVVLDRGPVLLLDFGNAGAAPIGADLHAVRRYLGPGGPSMDDLVATYCEVFELKGIPVDPAGIRLAADAHFAARYRNLRFLGARNRETFEAALATSLALIEREQAAGGLSGGPS
jgi:hypothetical protein